MTADQILTLLVLAAVVGALIWDKIRSDVVALTGAAFLLMTGVVRPVEVQSAFASPAIIALASLFVIAYALELSGLLDRAIEAAVKMCKRLGAAGLWVLLGAMGLMSAFLNSTPIVVLGAPVVRNGAEAAAQAVPDAIVVYNRIDRMLHSHRNLDQSSGGRHVAGRGTAPVWDVRNHASRRAHRFGGGALPFSR